MQEFSIISEKLRKISFEIQKNKKVFNAFIENIAAFNGEVSGIRGLSIEIENSVIKVDFEGFNFEVISQYKRLEDETMHSLAVYGFDLENKRKLLHSESFETNGNVANLSMHDDIEAMSILLNLIEQALQS